jgi:replicative DNA helicase
MHFGPPLRFSAAAAQTVNGNANLIQTRFSPLDQALGGGVRPGDSTLIIGQPGSGKTLLTCQIASAMAIAGTPTMIISTEETARQLAPRSVSHLCGIPYDGIAYGIDESDMTPSQLALYRNMIAKLNESVFLISHWEDSSKDLKDGFEMLMNETAKKMGRFPQVVFLDYLGGAFGKTRCNDPHVHRKLLQGGAVAMANLARRFNIHTITTAQANAKQCLGRIRVDASVLSECKTLDEPMTNVIGITALLNENAERNDGNDSSIVSVMRRTVEDRWL